MEERRDVERKTKCRGEKTREERLGERSRESVCVTNNTYVWTDVWGTC